MCSRVHFTVKTCGIYAEQFMGIESIRQRLKELGEDKFEELCFQTLKARYPEAGIHKVEGRGGDRGIDLFAGPILGRPTIWQCKFFANGVKDAQKRQIKKSLKSVLQSF